MRLILCEKPSQARDIKNALSDSFKAREGYFEGEKHIITWAYGHLLELCEPEDYQSEYKKWDINTLPIIPKEFKYKPTKEGVKQFKILKSLLSKKEVKSVVINTDAGREGELIARLILQEAENKKPCYRFWTSKALTPEVVREVYRHLREAREFDRLYQSALARQWADWLVGINATRAYSIKGGELYSIGRVQTPVLALICKREQEINNFKPEKYYNIEATFTHKNGEYSGIWISQYEGKDKDSDESEQEGDEGLSVKQNLSYIKTKEEVGKILNAIKGQFGVIKSVTTKVRTEASPLLYSLTTLQQEANKVYGYTAQKTLDIAQELYEGKKCLSYPRTDSCYLNEEMVSECERLVKLFRQDINIKEDINIKVSKKNKVFNDSKLTDHHGLIPLKRVTDLTEEERNIFYLVVSRFLMVFSQDFKYQHTVVLTEVGGNYFKSIGKVVIDIGWKALLPTQQKDKELPKLKEKDTVKTKGSEVKEKVTTPPDRYIDATILKAMANAHRYIEDKKLCKILKENAGIGTSSTRAGIIETLKKRGYITLKKKQLIPTAKAIALISAIQGEKVADMSYTAIWEQELEEIASGRKEKDDFMSAIKEYTRIIVENIKRGGIKMSYQNERKASKSNNELGKCPECKEGYIREGEKNFYCSNYKNNCKFVLWKNQLERLNGKVITAKMVKSLLKGNLVRMDNLVSPRTGNLFNAEGKLKKDEKWGWQIGLVLNGQKK